MKTLLTFGLVLELTTACATGGEPGGLSIGT